MTKDIDSELVARCQHGDQQAFTDLFAKYSGKIAGFARKYLRDEHYADDVVQDVFLQVHRKIHNFRGDARFSTWLFRVSVNACKSKRQSLERQRRIHDESIAPKLVRESIENPEHELQQRELRDGIEQCLASLSDEQRTLLQLKTVQELSYTQMSEVLNQSENQIRGKLYRARRAFRSVHESRAKAA